MTVRVGFLGAGFIATLHSKSLKYSGSDFVWSAVYDPEPGRADRFGAATGAEVCVTTEDVLDRSDAVYVCTWTAAHPPLVEAAASRGLAVFCEKPLAVDLAGAREVAGAVQTAGVINQVGLVLRHSPALVWLNHLVSDPAAGRVMSIVFRDDQFLPIQGLYASTWRADRALAGAGALLEHSIHDIDVLEWLGGTVETVACRTASFHGIDGIEDSVGATLTFAGGAIGTLVSVWHDVLERPSLRRIEVLCERRWCAIDDGDWFGPVRWVGDGQDRSLAGAELVEAARGVGLVEENPDRGFIEAVVAGRAARPDVGLALRAHEIVDGAYRSAASGGMPVDVRPSA